MRTPEGIRAYGAGLLSSGGELAYAVDSPEPLRVEFDVMTTMRTAYKIDSYQGTYFVIESFARLLEETALTEKELDEYLSPGFLTSPRRL